MGSISSTCGKYGHMYLRPTMKWGIGKCRFDMRTWYVFLSEKIDDCAQIWTLTEQKPFISKHIKSPQDEPKDPDQIEFDYSQTRHYGDMDGPKYLGLWKDMYNEDVQLSEPVEEDMKLSDAGENSKSKTVDSHVHVGITDSPSEKTIRPER
jgi:hypothetical protein